MLRKHMDVYKTKEALEEAYLAVKEKARITALVSHSSFYIFHFWLSVLLNRTTKWEERRGQQSWMTSHPKNGSARHNL